MDEMKDIKVKKLVVHIVDSSMSLPILSDGEHPLDDVAYEFVNNHIFRILSDDSLKDAGFKEESSIKDICKKISDDQDAFIACTGNIASMLHKIIQSSEDIPPCDLVCALILIDGVPHFSILKMNYKPSYIHYVTSTSDGNVNFIIRQKTTLPGENQKIDECAIINLKDFTIKVLEKKYEVNGEKIFYFSEMLLRCSCSMSDKEKVQILKKATKSFNKKYFNEDIEKSADVRYAIAESLENKDTIDVEEIAGNMFKYNPGMKDTYLDHMEKAGLNSRIIDVKPELSEKAFKRHKIKTDTGIEINLPVEYYKDRDMFEFINNPDGTISIMIKNISSITDV